MRIAFHFRLLLAPMLGVLLAVPSPAEANEGVPVFPIRHGSLDRPLHHRDRLSLARKVISSLAIRRATIRKPR